MQPQSVRRSLVLGAVAGVVAQAILLGIVLLLPSNDSYGLAFPFAILLAILNGPASAFSSLFVIASCGILAAPAAMVGMLTGAVIRVVLSRKDGLSRRGSVVVGSFIGLAAISPLYVYFLVPQLPRLLASFVT